MSAFHRLWRVLAWINIPLVFVNAYGVIVLLIDGLWPLALFCAFCAVFSACVVVANWDRHIAPVIRRGGQP